MGSYYRKWQSEDSPLSSWTLGTELGFSPDWAHHVLGG
jgi:hypothetical protein